MFENIVFQNRFGELVLENLWWKLEQSDRDLVHPFLTTHYRAQGESSTSNPKRPLFANIPNKYKDKMAMLMRADPGLDRRFPLRINLPDYTPEDLGQICRSFAANKFGKQFEPGLARPAQTKQIRTRLGLCGAHS